MFDLWYRDLEIYEGSSAFYIVYHLGNGDSREACMGDGVDMYTLDTDDGLEFVPVGTPKFYELLSADLIINHDTFMEAYFGDEQ